VWVTVKFIPLTVLTKGSGKILRPRIYSSTLIGVQKKSIVVRFVILTSLKAIRLRRAIRLQRPVAPTFLPHLQYEDVEDNDVLFHDERIPYLLHPQSGPSSWGDRSNLRTSAALVRPFISRLPERESSNDPFDESLESDVGRTSDEDEDDDFQINHAPGPGSVPFPAQVTSSSMNQPTQVFGVFFFRRTRAIRLRH
jgi:hypothetical protein